MTYLYDQFALTRLVEFQAFMSYISQNNDQSNFVRPFVMILRHYMAQFCIVAYSPLLIQQLVNCWLRRYILSLKHKKKFSPHVIHLIWKYLLGHLPKIRTKLTQRLAWMNVATLSRRATRRLNVLRSLIEQHSYRPPQSNTTTIVPPSNSFGFRPTLSSNPMVSTLTKQFKKFLTTPPYVISPSSTLSALNFSSMSSFIGALDFGAYHHMSPDFSSFASLSPISFVFIITTNGTLMPLVGASSIITPHAFVYF